MANKRFTYLILIAFAIGTFFLVIVQYNSAKNVESLLKGNEQLLKELKLSNHLRTIDRDLLGVESRIRAAIATDDTSHLEGVDEKVTELLRYLDTIDATNDDVKVKTYLNRLQELAKEKIYVNDKLMAMYAATGRMNDTIFIANPRARRISDEITRTTQKIYASRQDLMTGLSNKIKQSGNKARLYGNFLVGFLLLSCGGLCWFIIKQFRQQNRLILKLDVSEKKALDALHIKENFLANMSHEIRTPLNAILGFTNLLQRKKLDSQAMEFTSSIQSAGENLLSIINDILDLSKIEAGMMRIVVSPFSVSGLVHSIETLFSEKVKEKGLTLKSTINKDVPDTLMGDATRLTQILVNLIGNALKFSDNGEIKIAISARKTDENSIYLTFTVTDNGIGIDKEKLDSIFDRFRQAEDSITRNYGGTGLGLSIVQNLIVMQHGKIEVESAPGKGTKFYFEIPYKIAPEQITNLPQYNETFLKHNMNPSLHFLVVDDNIMNQSLMRHLLQQWNASFDIVSGGAEALEMLKKKSYDLILMDIQMPVMDGYTLASIIRGELKMQLPVIAMTAHAMAGEREKCLSHGMNEYISKPINENDLFNLIAKFVKYEKVDNSMGDDTLILSDYQYIDLTYMKEISKGNIDYERLVTSQFIHTIPNDISALLTLYAKGDIKEINHIAHNMKTTVAIMGLLEILENYLDNLEFSTELSSSILSDIAEVEAICNVALTEAELFIKSLTNNE